ncbi:MAG: guanine deaminase [Myxococcales bacterium]|nr:guanine deaminase [Myxococcales bacterium]
MSAASAPSQAPGSQTILRGRLLCPDATRPALQEVPDGLVHIQAGRITAVEPAPPGCALPETLPGAIWLPGFVDTHVHFPQTRIIGSATGPLLDWLASSVFPEEARFKERAYAEAVAEEFCTALLRQGTTCASIFSSSDPGATDVLFAALARRGLQADVGLTLMDQGAPPEVLLAATPALEAAEALIARWHGRRLRFAVTPRFALSCTPALLRGAGDLAARHGLPIQTHLAENHAEIAEVGRQFPGCHDYLGVYADHGLCTPHSLFAHCVHLEDGAWDRLAAAGAAVSHCPDSNFFLGSGCMPLDAPRRRGIRVGLGTDVGAGRSFSLRRIAASAYDAALITGAEVTGEELLWLATAGGARALGLADEVGRIAPGLAADLIALPAPPARDGQVLCDALVHQRDAGPVWATWVAGAPRWTLADGASHGDR